MVMNAVILNGSNEDETSLKIWENIITKKLETQGWQVNTVELRNKKLATCIGCFGCWIKTPGQCILNDEGQEIAKTVARSDFMILLTPITFGGYSYQLKKMLDRLIPNLLPIFTKINGEIHHKPRYIKNPKLLALGYLSEHDEESERIFEELVGRNAINMSNPANHAEIITGTITKLPNNKITTILKNIGVTI